MKRVDYSELIRCVKQLYEKAGVSEEHALYQAENLVSCEAKGIWSHGIGLGKRHLEDIVAGKINLKPKFRIAENSPTTVNLDGDNGPGTAVAVYALREAIKRAKKAGMASVCVTGGNHYGAGHYYAQLAAEENMLLFLYGTGDATAAPFGGRKRYFGTNPYTFGSPAGKYAPYILDMATTIGAARKVQQCAMDKIPAPEGWGIDKDGNPTQDPEQILGDGAMLHFGGPKGYGLAGMIDIMGGVLTGAAFRNDICCMPVNGGKVNFGYFLQAIDISRFMPVGQYNERMETLVEDLTNIPSAPGFKEVLYPGEMEGRKLKSAKKDGVELSDMAYEALEETAKLVGVRIKDIL